VDTCVCGGYCISLSPHEIGKYLSRDGTARSPGTINMHEKFLKIIIPRVQIVWFYFSDPRANGGVIVVLQYSLLG